MKWTIILLVAVGTAIPALAAPLDVTKTALVVSAPVPTTVPRSIPGAQVDYTITLSNPVTNLANTVRNIAFEDPLPADMVLRVADLGAGGSGPVAFVNGAVLGLGDSGLTYAFSGLGSTTDGVDFWNGLTWSYTPVPDADGFDPAVRAIRVKPTGTFKTSGSFTLRFRVKIR